MVQTEELVVSSGDAYTLPVFNTAVKFTPVMEEVLLTLEVLFVINLSPVFTNITTFLHGFLQRSLRSLGTALQSLADLGLIKYYRKGSSRVVELQLHHPFISSSLHRFFGWNDWLLDEPKGMTSSEPSFGFLPSTENFSAFLSFLKNEIQQLDAHLSKYRDWLDWVKTMEQTIRHAKKVARGAALPEENDPFEIFAEEVLLRIKEEQMKHSHHLYFEELVAIITETLLEHREMPPWIDESTLLHQSTMLDDFLREKFYGSQTE